MVQQSRTQLVADLLSRQQQQRQQRPIFSVGQGIAGLGSDLITALTQSKAAGEQEEKVSARNQAQSDALAKILGAPEGGRQSAIAEILGGGALDQAPGLKNILIEQALQPQQQQESFKPTFGPQGGITGQRSSLTGRVVADPRAAAQQDTDIIKDAQGFQRFTSGPNAGKRVFPDVEAPQKEGFENITDADGNVIGQLNTVTGEETASPSGQETRRLAEVERKSIEKQAKQTTARDAARQNVLDTKAVVERLLFSGTDEQGNKIDNDKLGSAFGKSGISAIIPGSEAADVQAQITTLKARLGFDQLQKMREASPTGGALGQVSERELTFLQATVQSLDFNQSDKQARENMILINESLDRWLATVEQPVPEGMIDNGDGTFTLPDGRRVVRE